MLVRRLGEKLPPAMYMSYLTGRSFLLGAVRAPSSDTERHDVVPSVILRRHRYCFVGGIGRASCYKEAPLLRGGSFQQQVRGRYVYRPRVRGKTIGKKKTCTVFYVKRRPVYASYGALPPVLQVLPIVATPPVIGALGTVLAATCCKKNRKQE